MKLEPWVNIPLSLTLFLFLSGPGGDYRSVSPVILYCVFLVSKEYFR